MNLRRDFLKLSPLAIPFSRVLFAAPPPPVVSQNFPMQPTDMVREMVSVSHGNVKRVRELVEAHPSLAKAAWDWGFGDWETALGAASHVGNREIAEYLIAHGAPPTLYSATMLGQVDVVKALVIAQPGIQKTPGPHGISLLAHAKNGGPNAEAVFRFLDELGDAGSPAPHPLTEAELTALAGVYTFGSGPADRVEITLTRGSLMFLRTGMVARGMTHVGGKQFYPAGASAVRIRFEGEGADTVLSVHDPDLVLQARRLPPG